MWFSEGVAERLLSLGLRISCFWKTKKTFDLVLLLIEGSYRKTPRQWVSQLDAMSYLFWYDPFYHGNFKFNAKLGLGAVLLTFSYHSDSKMGHVIKNLLTGCSCRTRKYKPLVFQTALASSGCMKNVGLVFPGTALAPS